MYLEICLIQAVYEVKIQTYFIHLIRWLSCECEINVK